MLQPESLLAFVRRHDRVLFSESLAFLVFETEAVKRTKPAQGAAKREGKRQGVAGNPQVNERINQTGNRIPQDGDRLHVGQIRKILARCTQLGLQRRGEGIQPDPSGRRIEPIPGRQIANLKRRKEIGIHGPGKSRWLSRKGRKARRGRQIRKGLVRKRVVRQEQHVI